MIGMLWLDAEKKRSMDERVRRAATFFRDKHGRNPIIVYANAKQVKAETAVDGIVVRPSKNILLHHLYLIIEDK